MRRITLEDFPKFQQEKYNSPSGPADLDTRNPRHRKINLDRNRINILYDILKNIESKHKDINIKKYLTGLINRINNAYNSTNGSSRYCNNEYCVTYDNLFLFEALGLMETSSNYQVIYRTDKLLSEILGCSLGFDTNKFKDKLIQKLKDDKIEYNDYCDLILGSKSDSLEFLADTSYLFNIDPFLDAFFTDLKERVQYKQIAYHQNAWLDYDKKDWDLVLNKAILYNLLDLQQFILDSIIKDLIDFRFEIRDSLDDKTPITSIGRGGFVIQTNSLIEFPTYKLINCNDKSVCEIKPLILDKKDCVSNYIKNWK